MTTVSVSLKDVLPEHMRAGFDFKRIELMDDDSSPLALVWYTTSNDPTSEIGARLDLDKQAFLDDFGMHDRLEFRPAARQIVEFLHGRTLPAAVQGR